MQNTGINLLTGVTIHFFEQHEFELQGSTYTWIFSNKYYSGTDPQVVELEDAEPPMQKADLGLERPQILVSKGGPGTGY